MFAISLPEMWRLADLAAQVGSGNLHLWCAVARYSVCVCGASAHERRRDRSRKPKREKRVVVVASFVNLFEGQHGGLLILFLFFLHHPAASPELRRELLLLLLLPHPPRLRGFALELFLPVDGFLRRREPPSFNPPLTSRRSSEDRKLDTFLLYFQDEKGGRWGMRVPTRLGLAGGCLRRPRVGI